MYGTTPAHQTLKQAAAHKPRSFNRFEAANLDFLLAAALANLRSFEARYRHHRRLAATLICVALC